MRGDRGSQALRMGASLSGSYYVYIITDRHNSTLYTGFSSNLERRMSEHKSKAIPGFTTKYHVNRLVYFEETSDVLAAITREKEIKGWTRAKKIALIESANPRWDDLSEGWSDPATSADSFGDHAVVAQNDRRRVKE